MEARTTPVIFVVIVPPSVYGGLKAMRNMPRAEKAENRRTLAGYGIAWMK